jgi:hypothetical protein
MLSHLIYEMVAISVGAWIIISLGFYSTFFTCIRIHGKDYLLGALSRLIYLQSFVVGLISGVRPWNLDQFSLPDVSLLLTYNRMVYEGIKTLMWSAFSITIYYSFACVALLYYLSRTSTRYTVDFVGLQSTNAKTSTALPVDSDSISIESRGKDQESYKISSD